MLNLSTKISVTVLIVLAVTHYSCAMSAAAAQAVAGANAILNNASIPQEYKVNIHDYSITLIDVHLYPKQSSSEFL